MITILWEDVMSKAKKFNANIVGIAGSQILNDL